jgi:hypothetical protein
LANAGGSSTIVSNFSRSRSSPRNSSNTLPTRASIATPFRVAFSRTVATASSEMSNAIVSVQLRASFSAKPPL